MHRGNSWETLSTEGLTTLLLPVLWVLKPLRLRDCTAPTPFRFSSPVRELGCPSGPHPYSEHTEPSVHSCGSEISDGGAGALNTTSPAGCECPWPSLKPDMRNCSLRLGSTQCSQLPIHLHPPVPTVCKIQTPETPLQKDSGSGFA